jgi:alanine racemase
MSLSTSLPTPRTWATIDLAAVRFNLARVRELCPQSDIMPVIKADAYGHGMLPVAKALVDSNTGFQTFAVAALQEALELSDGGFKKTIMLLPGCINKDEVRLCLAKAIEPAIHSAYQLSQYCEVAQAEFAALPKTVWVKFNTGMNRLGQRESESIAAYRQLAALPNTRVIFMSHLGYADDMNAAPSKQFTDNQVAAFERAKAALSADTLSKNTPNLVTSFAASAGILTRPDTHQGIVRPGVMLYGSSPLAKQSGLDLGLQPVMTLSSRLIAINDVAAGETIGYNATYTCAKQTRVGVVSVGYGDGYPRSANTSTPILVKAASGPVRTNVIGRVSMDMITIDLSHIPDAQINSEVVLWGQGLEADEVAKTTGTIAYELFCQVTKRAVYNYIN